MTTKITILSTDENLHRVKVVKRHKEVGVVVEENLLRPGESHTTHIYGDTEVVVTETLERSLEDGNVS